MKYNVVISEKLKRIVEVNTPTSTEAIEFIKKQYQEEKIVLDYSDFDGEVIIENQDDEIEKEAFIKDIIDYLYEDEQKHFEECFGEKSPEKEDNHIFYKLYELKKLYS